MFKFAALADETLPTGHRLHAELRLSLARTEPSPRQLDKAAARDAEARSILIRAVGARHPRVLQIDDSLAAHRPPPLAFW